MGEWLACSGLPFPDMSCHVFAVFTEYENIDTRSCQYNSLQMYQTMSLQL